MLIAITRKISRAISQCELTHVARVLIDLDLARRQHEAYEARLAELGCQVQSLPEAPDQPDSVFVEDTAVVLDEVAIITRPGSEPRRKEVAAVAQALAPYRTRIQMEAPATVEGGDVLVASKDIYVGLTSRSNQAGVQQMQAALAPHGYRVKGVPVRGCLHLKSAATLVQPGLLLINPAWVDAQEFGGLACMEVDPSEPNAANAVLIGDTILYPTAFPRTLARLRQRGIRVVTVDASEVAKAEGAVTCCSLIFRT